MHSLQDQKNYLKFVLTNETKKFTKQDILLYTLVNNGTVSKHIFTIFFSHLSAEKYTDTDISAVK